MTVQIILKAEMQQVQRKTRPVPVHVDESVANTKHETKKYLKFLNHTEVHVHISCRYNR